MSYLLDTNFISEMVRPVPNPKVIEWMRRTDPEQLFLSVITFGEIRRGTELLHPGSRRRALERWISEDLSQWFENRLLLIGRDVAEQYGKLGAESKRKGWGVESADALIAATAQVHDLTLATLNRKHFEKTGIPLLAL